MSRDTLSEVLRSVRLRGAVFLHVEGDEPWVAEAPPSRELAAVIMPAVDHMMEYHAVTKGSCWGAVVGERPVRLEAGDVIMFPHGDAHVMSSAPGLRAAAPADRAPLAQLGEVPVFLNFSGDTATLTEPGACSADCTTLVCGFFGCDMRPFNPLVASLPRLLHVRAANAGNDGWIEQFMRFAVAESREKRPGGEALLERLSETMFVELVRRYLDGLPEGQTGWLAGLRDRFVGRALALMHERPGADWNIDTLAEKVGLSRSALHERFAEFTGQPPMQYLAHWRMQIASGLLTQTNANVASIALEVGYESEAAFSRAFKRATGVPPATWRRQRATLPQRPAAC
jgi:AraC-like DNA-binding protein